MTDLILQDGNSSVGHRIQELPELKSKNEYERIREELDQYMERMTHFGELEPDEVYVILSSFTARATEIKVQLSRTDTARANGIRNREIEPFLLECDRQFKYYSRIQTSRELDFKISGGAT